MDPDDAMTRDDGMTHDGEAIEARTRARRTARRAAASIDESADDDLLRPTLTEADDVAGFRRPWDPGALVLLTFFCGLPAGGALLALNERRLGKPRRATVTSFAIVIVASLIIYTVAAWFTRMQPSTEDLSGASELPEIIARAVSILVAGWIARGQRQRSRLARVEDVPRGKLLGPAILAIVAGNGGLNLYRLAVVSMFRALGPT